jgi:hypothetical protein
MSFQRQSVGTQIGILVLHACASPRNMVTTSISIVVQQEPGQIGQGMTHTIGIRKWLDPSQAQLKE